MYHSFEGIALTGKEKFHKWESREKRSQRLSGRRRKIRPKLRGMIKRKARIPSAEECKNNIVRRS